MKNYDYHLTSTTNIAGIATVPAAFAPVFVASPQMAPDFDDFPVLVLLAIVPIAATDVPALALALARALVLAIALALALAVALAVVLAVALAVVLAVVLAAFELSAPVPAVAAVPLAVVEVRAR